jgi:hypothetical protein
MKACFDSSQTVPPCSNINAVRFPREALEDEELEALEDEERGEMGGRELIRTLTLIMEDGSLAGGWDRRSPATVVSVSALE